VLTQKEGGGKGGGSTPGGVKVDLPFKSLDPGNTTGGWGGGSSAETLKIKKVELHRGSKIPISGPQGHALQTSYRKGRSEKNSGENVHGADGWEDNLARARQATGKENGLRGETDQIRESAGEKPSLP